MSKFVDFLKDSHHWQHILIGFIASLVVFLLYMVMKSLGWAVILSIGIIAVYSAFIGGAAMEFKDKAYGNKFDFVDLFCTVAGGLIISLLWTVIALLLA